MNRATIRYIFLFFFAALIFALSFQTSVFAGKGPSDESIDTVASVTFDQPATVDEVLKIKESSKGQVSLIESDFVLGPVTIHDFYPVPEGADAATIQSDYVKNRMAGLQDFLKDKDSLTAEQRKELAAQYEAAEKILKESFREEVKISKAMILGKKANLEKIKSHQKVKKLEIKDGDGKIDKNKEPKQIPDGKVTLGSDEITSFAATTGSTWIPNNGTSVTAVAAEGGRYTRQYMRWGTMVFAHEDTYEHDFYLYNYDRYTYLNGASTAYPNCFPVATYASTSWPAASMPYLDSRNGFPDRVGCDIDELSYTIGAARADQLVAGVTYNNYIRTKTGNAASDKFKINAQLGYRSDDTCYTTWCSWSESQVRLVNFTAAVPGTFAWTYTGGRPAAPSNVSVVNPTSSSLQINFYDNATNEAGIKVERKTGTTGTWGLIATFGVLSNTGGWYWINTGLAANTTYCYRLRAYNTYGNSSYSNEACGRTTSSTRTEVIIDDTSSNFVRGGSYWWQANIGYGGHMYWTYVNGGVVDSWGEWTATLGGGNYEVYAFIPSNYATTTSAKYQIYHSAGTTVRTVNQNNYYDAWVSLGTYGFSTGTARRVRLTDATGETNYSLRVGFDAVRFIPR